MGLLEQTIHDQLPRMFRHQISLRFIGDRSQLSPHLQALMADAERQTAHLTRMTLVIAVSYGGQWMWSMPVGKLPSKLNKANCLLPISPSKILPNGCHSLIFSG